MESWAKPATRSAEPAVSSAWALDQGTQARARRLKWLRTRRKVMGGRLRVGETGWVPEIGLDRQLGRPSSSL